MANKWHLSEQKRDRLFEKAKQQGYVGVEMLDNQPAWFVPDDWRDEREKWMSESFLRYVFGLHADFLESLFDEEGYTTLYRAMGTEGFKQRGHRLPQPGEVVDIGEHFTYSADADLSDAQFASDTKFDIVFPARVHFSQIDWPNTLSDHLHRNWHEKQLFVKGPVEILDVLRMGEFRREGEKIKFDKWLKKAVDRHPVAGAG